jgi:hypothetical protein
MKSGWGILALPSGLVIHTWVFTVGSGDSASVTLRALAANGTVLAELDHDLLWTRVGGSEQCGGPVTTPPINLSVS